MKRFLWVVMLMLGMLVAGTLVEQKPSRWLNAPLAVVSVANAADGTEMQTYYYCYERIRLWFMRVFKDEPSAWRCAASRAEPRRVKPE